VKNDNKDAEAIARLAKYQDVKFSLVPKPQILALRMMAREYYALADTLTEMKNRLSTDLYMLFPGFLSLFSNPFGKASMAILPEFPSPKAIQKADRDYLTALVAQNARKGHQWALKKVDALFEISTLVSSMPKELSILDSKIKIHLDGILHLQGSLEAIETQFRQIDPSR